MTVGDIAVGIDPDTIEMVLPGGAHVIANHVDCTCEGTAVQGGDEAG